MTNNDILRRLRYVFDLPDNKMAKMFTMVDAKVEQELITSWLKKDDDPDYKSCSDVQLASFLNGFIVARRGKREGIPTPIPETRINNNIVLRKLKIALNYQSEDMLEIIALAGIKFSAHELSAFFRKEGHKHHRECKDQFMRSFFQGLTIKYRPDSK